MKGKKIEEKELDVLRNLRNIVHYDFDTRVVQIKCPVCGVVFEDTIYKTYKRMFQSRQIERNQEEFYNLPCKNRTCINRYGNTALSKEKQRKTNLLKYGVDSILKLDEIKEKSKQAKVDKYGSFSKMIKKNWEKYKEKTGYSHNMRNPNSMLINRENRLKTINSMSYERKKIWSDRRMETYKKNGNTFFGGKRPKGKSNQQEVFFRELTEKSGLDIIYGEKEFLVRIDKKFFFLDGYIEELNIAIEYNGDFWHANPNIYEENSCLSFPGKKILAKEIWDKDKKRYNLIKNKLGCEFIVVWEKDFSENKELTINIVIEKIKEIKNG